MIGHSAQPQHALRRDVFESLRWPPERHSINLDNSSKMSCAHGAKGKELAGTAATSSEAAGAATVLETTGLGVGAAHGTAPPAAMTSTFWKKSSRATAGI